MLENAKIHTLKALQSQIQGLEFGSVLNRNIHEVVPLGTAAIDGILPWSGLPRAAVHQITGERGAALGFTVALLARFAINHKPVLWCFRHFSPYAPGLHSLGFDPNHIIAIRPSQKTQVLWVLEEALRTHSLSVVIGEITNISLINSRRLQLAAQAGNTPCLLFCNDDTSNKKTTSITHWRVLPSNINASNCAGNSDFLSESYWQVELVRCRGTSGGHRWIVRWCYETHCFSVVTPFSNRPKTSSVQKLRKTG